MQLQQENYFCVCLQRFGPPDQPYYYKKSDDAQPDDPRSSDWNDSVDIKSNVLSIF